MTVIAHLQASSSTTATLYLTETERSWRGEFPNIRFLILKYDSTLLHTSPFTPQENYRLFQAVRLLTWGLTESGCDLCLDTEYPD
jgi:hypothetical protein